MSSKKSNKPTENPINEKLRILCLHGFRQTGDTFKAKIGSFRKHVQKYADFVFVTAPHDVEAPAENSRIDEGDGSGDDSDMEDLSKQKSWWFNSPADGRSFKGTNKNGPAIGFDESLHLVEEAWQSLGPFHGLLGFSQGACFAGLICNLSQRGMTVIKPQFAILASGFRSGSLAHMNYYEELLSIPSLHIIGNADKIIAPAMSELLATCFEEPTVVRHPGGHYFAATSQQKQYYIHFLRNRLVEHLERKELEREDAVIVDSSADTKNPTTSEDADPMSDDSD